MMTLLFFMWGFMTVMNDVLIPHLKKVFELTYFQSMLVQFSFFIAYTAGSLIYFMLSASVGDPIQKIGYKNGIIGGLVLSALGCGLFYPAAIVNVYGLYLLALFVLGLGFTLLQIAANPYVSILGREETASSRLNLAQAFNSLGTTLGPLIGGAVIFTYFAGAEAVKYPYLTVGAIFLLLAFLFSRAKLPDFSGEKIESGAGALEFPHLRWGILAIFMYVGAEVAIGSFIINFLGLETIAGLDEKAASTFLSLYWGGLMIGRVMGAASLADIPDTLKKSLLMAGGGLGAFLVIFGANYLDSGLSIIEVLPYLGFMLLNFLAFLAGKSLAGRTLGILAVGNLILLGLGIFTTGQIALWAIISIGLFNSIGWSNIFTLAIEGLGKYKSQGSSLLVMAILGGALIPPLQGLFADFLGTEANPDAGVQLSFFIPLLCNIYIAWYGFAGYKAGRQVEA